jgi:NAD(P)H-flavin reductase
VLSILRDIVDRGIEREVTIFFGARAATDLCGLDDIGALKERLTNLEFVPALSRSLSEDWIGSTGSVIDVVAYRFPAGTRRISVRAAAEIDAATELLIARGSPPAQHLLLRVRSGWGSGS